MKDSDTVHQHKTPWPSRIIATVIVIILLSLAAFVVRQWHRPTPADRLVSAAASWRPLDGRLTGGFHWTTHSQSARNDGTRDKLARKAAASSVLKELAARTDADSLRLMAASYLVIDQAPVAVERLERASLIHKGNAALWSDFAAARLVAAIENRRAADLPLALAAADRAIELDAKLAEARFNRAAILERLGLSEQSRAEWKAYLDLDPSGDWSIEARRRMRRLSARPDLMLEFRSALQAQADGSANEIRAFVAAHPQEARTWGESLLFPEWAAHVECGDDVYAVRTFAQLKTIGSLLAERGDKFLADAVSVVDQTEGDPRRRKILVDAYLAYVDGRIYLNQQLQSDAEPLLRHATMLFRSAASPMAIVSEYFLANLIFDQSHVKEAREILTRLNASVDASRYPALKAQLQWQLALCDSSEGAWSSCMAHLREAHALFDRQGETANRAFLGAILAEAYDHVARVEDGWEYRLAALEILSRSNQRSRLAAALAGGIRAENFRKQYGSALALAAVAIEESVRDRQPHLIAEAHTRRAIVLSASGAHDLAIAAIAQARAAAESIKQVPLRRRANADLNVVEASIIRPSNPRRAIDLLSAAIAFYTERHQETWLPAAQLERGRAYRATGETRQALDDFEKGIREIERQRSTIDLSDLRSSFFDTAPDLFSEAVDLLIAEKQLDAAYAMTERARSRTLYEQLDFTASAPRADSAAQVRERLRPDEVIVEYQLLPSGLAIFCLDRSSLTVVRTNTDGPLLRRTTAALVDSVQQGRAPAARHAAAEAWRLLIAPVADRIDRARRLVIVPDRFLHALPFPALFDARTSEHLIERHELVLAPSGSLGGVSIRPFRTTPALIIGDPTNTNNLEPRLVSAAREARKIADLYGENAVVGGAATREAFLTRAPHCALIHYAGHAQSASDRNDNQLVLAGKQGSALLDASEIARLRLTHTSLVVLAACGTLRGNSDRVEGIPSLARAFMAAGVPSVVGTLWDVPDESSATLFLAFHRRLAQGMSPAAALRDAQIAEIHSSTETNMTWATIAIMGRG